MRNRRAIRKNREFKALSPLIFSVIGVVVIALICIPLSKNMTQKANVDEDIVNLQNEIALIESQNFKLGEVVDHLNSSEFSDEQARLNFNLKKSGESVAVIQMNETQDKGMADEKESSEEENISNNTKWLNYFFKRE